MRALEYLGLSHSPPSSPTSPSQTSINPPSTRAVKVCSDVISKLSPLVHPMQRLDLQRDLLKLATSAISVWTLAQTDELKIDVSASLDPAKRNEWRSLTFEPPTADNNVESDNMSSTHPRIFPLFPHVTAQRVEIPSKPSASPPGSWPQSEQVPRLTEICIHPGIGLPERSALVQSGVQEVKEIYEFLQTKLEEAKKEAYAPGRRNGGHSRQNSLLGGSSTLTSLTSPTAQWASKGTMKVGDE
jgi:hypothetical protein